MDQQLHRVWMGQSSMLVLRGELGGASLGIGLAGAGRFSLDAALGIPRRWRLALAR